MWVGRRHFTAFASAVLLWTSAAQAQRLDWNPTQFHATRQELQEMLARYEQAAQSAGYSAALRVRAEQEAALIKQRLTDGDFRVGDHIVLIVEGESALGDTLIVTPTLSAVLPTGDSISLKGVLRSEVQSRLSEAMKRVLKKPVVRAETFLRIAVTGGVANQGYYVVRSDALLTEVLARAGGVSSTAKLTGLRIERDNRRIWEGEALQNALAEGRTVDQLSMRAGDQLVVPEQKNKTGNQGLMRTLAFTIPSLFALFRLVKR
jgi:protein involved in polysaccharide export with SLBB domain